MKQKRCLVQARFRRVDCRPGLMGNLDGAAVDIECVWPARVVGELSRVRTPVQT